MTPRQRLLILVALSAGVLAIGWLLSDLWNRGTESMPPAAPNGSVEADVAVDAYTRWTEARAVDRFLADHHRRDQERVAAERRRSQPRIVLASGDVWHRLAMCETGGKMNNPNTGNGYYGFFQFDLSTWRSVGGPGYPHEHPYEVQRAYAQELQRRSGWGRWPKCSQVLGLR